jgi:ketosteroid isomerase-like protein
LFLFLLPVLFLSALSAFSAAASQVMKPPLRPTTSTNTGQDAIRQILDLERQSKDAAIHRDADFVQRTLADDYVAISPLGQIITKAETVAARKSGQLHYDSLEISDVVVRVYGTTAIVTARADVKGRDFGEEFSGPYRFTRVWVRRNGQWQAVSYQATVTR